MKKLLFLLSFLAVAGRSHAQFTLPQLIQQLYVGNFTDNLKHRNVLLSLDSASEGGSTIDTVNTLNELMTYNDSANALLWTDTLRGGLFTLIAPTLNDTGVTFPSAKSGSWVRLSNQSEGLNVLWYGAIPDDPSFDNGPILESIITNYSKRQGTVYFPPYDFYVKTQIGDVHESHQKDVNWDLTITGSQGSRIIVNSLTLIRSVLGFYMHGELSISNIEIDGGDIVCRGIYIDHNEEGFEPSRLYVDNVKVHNINADDGSIVSAAGIIAYGNFDVFSVSQSIVDSVYSNTLTSGIECGGSGLFGSTPRNVHITGNTVSNIFRTDTSELTNMDGLNLRVAASLKNDTIPQMFIVKGNYLENCRGRFVKVQAANSVIEDNYITTNSDFYISGNSNTAAIDLQYGRGTVSTNVVNFQSEKALAKIISVNERLNQGEDGSQLIVDGNRVVGNVRGFLHLAEVNNDFSGSIDIQNNVISSPVGSLIETSTFTDSISVRKFRVSNNSVQSVTNSFIVLDETQYNIVAISNEAHLDTPATFINVTPDDFTYIANVGFDIEKTFVSSYGTSAQWDSAYQVIRSGAVQNQIRTVALSSSTPSTTLQDDDHIVIVQCADEVFTPVVNLPSGAVSAQKIIIKKADQNAGDITVNPPGGHTIDNQFSTTVPGVLGSIQVVFDGSSDWWILNEYTGSI